MGILSGKFHYFYKKVTNKIYKDLRWTLGCIYFKGKVLNKIPDKIAPIESKNKGINIIRDESCMDSIFMFFRGGYKTNSPSTSTTPLT